MGFEGVVGDLKDSCNAQLACYQMGRFGNVGNLENSCNDDSACEFMGRDGSVGNLEDSCNGVQACDEMAYYGIVGNVVNSCNDGVSEEFPLVSSAPSSFFSPTITLCHIRNLLLFGLQSRRDCDHHRQLLQRLVLCLRRIRRRPHSQRSDVRDDYVRKSNETHSLCSFFRCCMLKPRLSFD